MISHQAYFRASFSPSGLLPLQSCHRPQLILESNHILLLYCYQVFPVSKEISMMLEQVAGFLFSQHCNWIVWVR